MLNPFEGFSLETILLWLLSNKSSTLSMKWIDVLLGEKCVCVEIRNTYI